MQIQPVESELTLQGDRYAPGPQQRKETREVCTDEEFLFEWDNVKFEANIAKHGIDFTDAVAIFDGHILETSSVKPDEERVKAIGYCEGILLTVIYTWRGRKRRIISARRAKRNERKEYHLHESQRGSPPKG